MLRTHLSTSPALEVRFDRPVNLPLHPFKPTGFWYAIADTWIEHCWENMPDRLTGKSYLYAIEIDLRRILQIKTVKDFITFEKTYAEPFYPGMQVIKKIRWEVVEKRYAGIEIAPFRPEPILCTWYFGWDCASGVLWHKNALRKVELVARGRKAILGRRWLQAGEPNSVG